MSGHNVPYQLRTNKFVERHLFLDLLDFVRIWNGPAKYLYASMGGRFLEDFKLINTRFPVNHMICVEMEKNTWKRQLFNRLEFIECRNQTSGDFVETLDSLLAQYRDHKLIVWLDYAVANRRGEQLGELRQLVSKMGSGDVAKVTLNANPYSFRRRAAQLTKKDFDNYLKDPESVTHRDYETYLKSLLANDLIKSGADRSLVMNDSEYESICISNFREQLGEYAPPGGISAEDLDPPRFASLLLNAIKLACLKGVEGTKCHVKPLAAFRYRDGEHQMLTATVVIADDRLSAAIDADPQFTNWKFRSVDWRTIREIAVPDISLKERLHLENAMPLQYDAFSVHSAIPFQFDEKEAVSIEFLRAYLDHYQRYPSFVRIQ